MYSTGVEQALSASLAAHAGQQRKGNADLPYISHPVHVALMLAKLGVEDVLIQAALLHDVVEDCAGWTLDRVAKEFGQEVHDLIAPLTDPEGESWEIRKEYGIEKAASMDVRCATVKAADKLHNLSSLVAAVRAADSPAEVWQPFSRGAETTLAMSRRLVEVLAARVDPRLGQALLDTMSELERLSR